MIMVNHCFVCGKDNPDSIGLEFEVRDDGVIVSHFSLGRKHEGYPNILHGGILAAILDDCMGNAIFKKGLLNYTVEMCLKYLKHCLVNEELEARGYIVRMNHKVVETEGEIVNSQGEVKVKATGKYYVVGPLEKQWDI